MEDHQQNPFLSPSEIRDYFITGMAVSSATPTATPAEPVGGVPVLQLIKPGDAFAGTLEVTSDNPVQGKISLQGLGESGASLDGLQAGFRCNPLLQP